MRKRVLITGGAGFIGSHVTDLLLASGYSVRILDCLTSQVHGLSGDAPNYLNRDAELIVGDVRDASAVARALEGIDAVLHLTLRAASRRCARGPRWPLRFLLVMTGAPSGRPESSISRS